MVGAQLVLHAVGGTARRSQRERLPDRKCALAGKGRHLMSMNMLMARAGPASSGPYARINSGLPAGRPLFHVVSASARWPRRRLESLTYIARAASRGEEAAKFAAEAQSWELPKRGILREDVEFRFSRSGGPGGQNVNKVETKAEGRLDVGCANFLPEWVKSNLFKKQANRINIEGILVVTSTEQRTQVDNIRIVMEKLQAMIDESSFIPKVPDKAKVKKMDNIKKAADRKRVDEKRQKSTVKNAKKDFKRGL